MCACVCVLIRSQIPSADETRAARHRDVFSAEPFLDSTLDRVRFHNVPVFPATRQQAAVQSGALQQTPQNRLLVLFASSRSESRTERAREQTGTAFSTKHQLEMCSVTSERRWTRVWLFVQTPTSIRSTGQCHLNQCDAECVTSGAECVTSGAECVTSGAECTTSGPECVTSGAERITAGVTALRVSRVSETLTPSFPLATGGRRRARAPCWLPGERASRWASRCCTASTAASR